MKLIEWFKKLFRKKEQPKKWFQQFDSMKVSKEESERTHNLNNYGVFSNRQRIDVAQIRREMRNDMIRTKNLERQQSVLGHGLSSKWFKPRPAHEKQTFKLHEKPEDD